MVSTPRLTRSALTRLTVGALGALLLASITTSATSVDALWAPANGPTGLSPSSQVDASTAVDFDAPHLEESVSTGTIYAMTQDHLGFAWFATGVGLVRWDGLTTDIYNSDLISELPIETRSVTDVAPAPTGVWAVADGELILVEPFAGTVDSTGVAADYISGQGETIWVVDGTTVLHVRLGDGDESRVSVEHSFKLPERPENGIQAVATETHFALATSVGVTTFNATGEQGSAVIPSGADALTVDQDGSLLIGSGSGVWSMQLNSPKRATRLASFAEAVSVSGLVEDQDGAIWISRTNGELYAWEPTTETLNAVTATFPTEHGDDQYARIIGVDSQNGLWATLDGVGTFRHRTTPLPVEALAPGPHGHAATTAMAILDDDVWFGTKDAGLWRVDLETGERVAIESPETIDHLVGNADGMWFSSRSDLWRVDPDSTTALHLPPLVDERITALSLAPDGRLWIGYENGDVRVFDGARPAEVYPAADQHVGAIRSLLHVDDRVWVAGSHGVAVIGAQGPTAPDWERLDQHLVGTDTFDLDSIGSLLIVATNAGLEVIDTATWDITTFGQPDGISSQINALTATAEGQVWLATNAGIALFDLERAQIVRPLRTTDGLPTEVATTLAVGPGGRLFVGTTGGAAEVLAATTNAEHGAALITSVHVDGRATYDLSNIGTSSLVEFRFSVVDFDAPHSAQFRYRLHGFDDGWVLADPDGRVAVYQQLGEGDYRFELEAIGPDGSTTTTPSDGPGASQTVTARRSFIEQRWVRVSIAGVLIGLVGLALLLRIRRQRRNGRQLEALVSARTAELAEAVRSAEEASDAQSRFLAMISHELRTPLSSVIGFAQLISNADDPDQSRRWGKKVEIAGEHLNEMIEELLATASMGQLQEFPDATPAVLPDFLDEVTTIARPSSESNPGITLEIDPDLVSLDLPVLLDRRRLRQVLINLLDNAIRHSDDQPVVLSAERIKRTEYECVVGFEVTNTGPGMTEAQVEQSMQPFVRGSDRNDRGLGLGLSICQHLVQILGGELWATSHPDGPTTFGFTLPLELNVVREAPNACTTKVLAVDDDPAIRELLADSLSAAGFFVRTASSAEEALEMLDEMQPDAIVTDHRMPRLTGDALARRARRRLGSLEFAVIAVTASPEDARTVGSYTAVISKPFRARDLVRTINHTLAAEPKAKANHV